MSEQVAGASMTQTAARPIKVSDAPQSSWAKARERLAWTLVAPSILVVAIVAFYPLAQSIRLSFTNARLAGEPRGGERYIGFNNYDFLLNSDEFIRAFRNTVTFTVSSVAAETILGIIVALIINSQFKGRGLLRTAILVPWAIPTVVSSRLWEFMYRSDYGVVSDILGRRLPQLFDWIPLIGDDIAGLFPSAQNSLLADTNTSLGALVAVDVWKTTPFMALLILAGLQIIPGDIYEAARVDGASAFQQFWQMTLPLLRPALLVALIFRTLDAFRVFDVIYVMKGPALDTQSLAIYAQQQLVNGDRLGRTSAASVLIFLCIAVLVFIYTRLVKVEEA
jgi:trehalose/maltose transport system permease protein